MTLADSMNLDALVTTSPEKLEYFWETELETEIDGPDANGINFSENLLLSHEGSCLVKFSFV